VNLNRAFKEFCRRGIERKKPAGIQLILWANGTCSMCRVRVQLYLKTQHNTESIQRKKCLGLTLVNSHKSNPQQGSVQVIVLLTSVLYNTGCPF